MESGAGLVGDAGRTMGVQDCATAAQEMAARAAALSLAVSRLNLAAASEPRPAGHQERMGYDLAAVPA